MHTFKNGNILSLTVKNFQTFTEQTFKFGPSLNLIAAPNGSGKSTIANAIALVFNGSPKTIGKATQLAEYIKFGCNEAEIAVEVLHKNNLTTLSRRFTANRNNYFINGSIVLQREYFKLIEEMKIDVNNLCTFLPQERVGEFSRMNPRELLSELLKYHNIDTETAKNLYDSLAKVKESHESNVKNKEMVETTLNMIESDIKEIKEREECTIKLQKLEYKTLLVTFETLKRRYIEQKTEISKYNTTIALVDSKINEILKRIEENENNPVFSEYKKGVEILCTQNVQIGEIEKSLRSKVEQAEMIRSEIQTKAEQRERSIAEKKQEIERLNREYSQTTETLEKEINSFKQKIEAMCNDPNLEALLVVNKKALNSLNNVDDIELALPSLRKIDEKIQNYSMGISQIQHISEGIQRKIEDLEKQKKMSSEQSSMRLEMFRKYHSDSYKGVLWLRENARYFKGEILEPLYLHINIKEGYSKYVESFLSFQALSSFITTNEDDFTLLAQALKDKLKLSVNVAMHSPSRSPGISKADLARFNLDGVLSDFIECRREYMDFLNNYGHFNSIPLSIREIKEEEVYMAIPECRRMAIGNRFSEVRRSKYGDDYVIVTNKLQQKDLFDFPKIDVEQIERELDALRGEREKNKSKVEKILEEKNELNTMKGKLKVELDISKINVSASRKRKLRASIEYERRQLDEIEMSETSESMVKRLEAINKEILSIHNRLFEILDPKNIPKFDPDNVKNLKLDLENDYRQLNYQNIHKSEEVRILENLEKQKSLVRESIEETKRKIREYPVFESLDDLPVEMHEVEAEIEYLRTKLAVMKPQSHIEKDYNEKQALLKSISENTKDLKEALDDFQVRYDKEKDGVVEKILAVLDPINTTFQKLFNRFGFEGILKLDTTGRDWELKILVKFRKEEELQQLSSFRQSGGEKSLTTVLFLLSLQQCEASPFRLVDEINQGMDHHNERRVFEVLKEMGDRSQFFIITPKLIRDLEFSNDTTAIIVYGGPGITKDIEKYARQVCS